MEDEPLEVNIATVPDTEISFSCEVDRCFSDNADNLATKNVYGH